MRDLSVIIPGKNEEFFQQTIDNVLLNTRADTEVIAVVDGYAPDPPILPGERVIVINEKESIGQRAAVNKAAKFSTARYIMKLDAHCAVDKGFDAKLMETMQPDWTVIPLMYNLHAFDWQCKSCGERTMQGPMPEKCGKCGCNNSQWFEKVIVWEPKWYKGWHFMRFDSNLKFQYWYDYKKRARWDNGISDLMCAIGACWFQDRKRFLELGGLDEGHGSWGQVGVEVACKAWLSGGRHVMNRKTWFSHMFRTNNAGFSFPYKISGHDVHQARIYSRKLWKNGTWDKAERPLEWIVDKFHPVPGWDDHKPKGKARPYVKNSGDSDIMLSVIIPARNEMYLQATIDDIFKNFKSSLEIIVGLDNYDPDPPLRDDPRVKVVRADKRVGMRRLINVLAARARGRFIMKTDAHCSFDKGYDTKLMAIYEPGATVLGIRYELDVTTWERKERTNCDFRYLSYIDDPLGGLRGLPWHEQKDIWKGKLVAESMSLSGSGWMMERKQWERWGPLDENHGTMYQEGCEIACRTWLSGGRLLIGRDTWYAHWNRGKAPYALAKKQRSRSIDYSIDYWMNNRWPLQKYSFNWLIDKFKPPGWPEVTHEPMKAKRQGTILKGIRKLRVETLWQNRVAIGEPLKRYRLEIFWDAFDKFLKGDEERYRNYLITHLSKRPKEPDKRGRRRVEHKIRTAYNLLENIKKNGMLTPLDFYQVDGNLTLHRGYRRLGVARHLGMKYVAGRVAIDEKVAKKYVRPFSYPKGSLCEIGAQQFARLGGRATDKWYVHNYLPYYDSMFGSLRGKKIKLLEIGLFEGASLALWHEGFPKAMIYGLDITEKWRRQAGDLDRLKVFQGDQTDKVLLSEVAGNGPYDVIIDDCGHNPDQQWASFVGLWDSVKTGGWYIIEDYYRSFESGYNGRNVPAEFASWLPSIHKTHEVLSLQFYYNMCAVQKGMAT